MPFAGDELEYFLESQVQALHDSPLPKTSNKLAATLINLSRKFLSGKVKAQQKKREQKERNEEKTIKQKAHLLLTQLTSREVVREVFVSIKQKSNFSEVKTIETKFSGKLVNRLNLDWPLSWLVEGLFVTSYKALSFSRKLNTLFETQPTFHTHRLQRMSN